MTEDENKKDLLKLLQAHGKNFLSSFEISPQTPSDKKRKRRKLDLDASDSGEQSSSDEDVEWTGFGSDNDSSAEEPDGASEGEGGDEIEDDDFTSEAISNPQAEVVVFSGSSASEAPRLTKAQAKAFMSSKISKLSTSVPNSNAERAEDDDEADEIERDNMKNDALLHKLVHTQILSGSLKSDLNLKPFERRKALEGRVLELAGGAKLGFGETSARKEERSKASKKVREGLERKVEERRVKSLEEAKNLGNYHRTIKHVYEDDSKAKDDRRRRDRGLKVGVGRFSDGVLKLSRSDVVPASSRGRDSRRGRGGSGSRKRS